MLQSFQQVFSRNVVFILHTTHFRDVGLIDQKETPEEAAIRELEEETGYKAKKVLQSTTLLVSDPGQLFLLISFTDTLHFRESLSSAQA